MCVEPWSRNAGCRAGAGVKQIPLTRGKFAIVDNCDYERVSQFNWQAARDHKHLTWYAQRTVCLSGGKRTTQLMHRFILSMTNPSLQVDHKDGDGLHNWRRNLRVCTYRRNQANNRLRNDNTSHYKGVTWDKRRRKWKAQIGINQHMFSLGRFADQIDAAKAYDKAALAQWGEFAKLNFPQKEQA